MVSENTPPPSPGVGGLDDDDQIYEDEIEEEIDIGEGTLEVNIFYLEAENLLLICVPRSALYLTSSSV